MDEKNISQSVLEKIKEEKITPTPKWEFLAKNYLVWSFGVFAWLFGGVAVSVIIYFLNDNDWAVHDKLAESWWQFVLLTLPYFWIIVMTLFVLLMNYNLKHTKHGYKYKLKIIIPVCILASFILGATLYAGGMGRALDDLLSRNAPFYRHIMNRQIDNWTRPEKGLLIGLINSISSENFQLVDPRGQVWLVTKEKLPSFPPFIFVEGDKVKIIGEENEGYVFSARMIFPAGPGKGCFENPNTGGCFTSPLRPRPLNLNFPGAEIRVFSEHPAM